MMKNSFLKKSIKTAVTVSLSFSVSLTAFADNFTLSSPDLSGQLTKAQEFIGFGCTGGNISPKLMWSHAPEGTKSFAVTVYDVDAPTAAIGKGGFWHWTIFNIPANVTELKENTGNVEKNLEPKGSIQGVNSYGATGFGGACPPEGDNAHAYIITVYALKTNDLGVKETTTPDVVGFLLGQNTIQKASIISYYQR